MITLRQLDIFVEAVRAGSFRRCAERLGMSAVAVSEHVRALEAEMGVALFERRAGLLPTLTDAGQRVYDRATVIVADVADLRREAGGTVKGGRRRMPVAIHTYLMRNLPKELARFREAWPQVDLDIDLSVRTNEEFVDRVARRQLDVAYCFALNDDDVPGSRHIRSEPLGIYVGQDHPLAKRDKVTLEELTREPVIQLSATEPLTILIDRLFAALGVFQRRIGLATDQLGLIVASLRHNQGYACLFADSEEGSGDALGLARVRLEVALPPLQVRRITRRSADADSALLDLCGRLEACWAAS
jgi:DNA-binding transcriptional LysR family regulator